MGSTLSALISLGAVIYMIRTLTVIVEIYYLEAEVAMEVDHPQLGLDCQLRKRQDGMRVHLALLANGMGFERGNTCLLEEEALAMAWCCLGWK